jgi:putative membrane protein
MKIITSFMALAATAILSTVMLTAPVFAQENPKLSDAEIAAVAVVANQIDINYGEIAKEKSKHEEVLKFAETMISDHKAVIAQAAALVKKLGVTPKDNAVSQKLLTDAEKTKNTLLSKSGEAFDKAYIDNEVAYHKAVIAAVQGLLIPETDNKELKDLLENVVPALRTHLEHAIMVQKELLK